MGGGIGRPPPFLTWEFRCLRGLLWSLRVQLYKVESQNEYTEVFDVVPELVCKQYSCLRRTGGWARHYSGRATPQKKYDPDLGNGARYAASICSILNPPALMSEGMSRVT